MESSLSEIAEVMGGRVSPDGTDKEKDVVRCAVIDSRKVEPGDLFFAFPGEKTEGCLYVPDAFRRGAAACVVTQPVSGVKPDRLIQVDDVGQALIRLATWYRSKINVPVAAVTGSSGKSTTKEIAAHLLRRHLNVLSAPESYNNEIGVPLALLGFKPGHQAVVLEMAMRGKGQIKELCEIASPNFGLITSIGEAHVGLLGSLEAIADAKGELLLALPKNGVAFLNSEDAWTPYLARKSRCPVRTYGFESTDWVRARNVRETWEGSAFELRTPGGSFEIFFPLPGRHNLLNLLGAAALSLTLGVPPDKIKEGAASCQTLHGRLERRRGRNGLWIVDDSYNANPGSVRAALTTLKELATKGRRVFVMGDMLELGEFAEEAHRKVGAQACALGIDAFFGLGELTAFAVKEARKKGMKLARHFPDHDALFGVLSKYLAREDRVLVKGSRKMAMERIVKRLVET